MFLSRSARVVSDPAPLMVPHVQVGILAGGVGKIASENIGNQGFIQLDTFVDIGFPLILS